MNYREKARNDAWETCYEYLDEMVEQAVQDGEVSDDLHNDYANGDSYHHENHVDKDYDLQEAAELLDQLSDCEETDYGLWQGLEPRRAIACQAAYTYGNAVMGEWQEIIEGINDHLDDMEYDNDVDKETYAKVYITLLVRFNNFFYPNPDEKGFQQGILKDIEDGDFGSALVFADYLEEKQDRQSLMKEIRELINERNQKLKEIEEDEEED